MPQIIIYLHLWQNDTIMKIKKGLKVSLIVLGSIVLLVFATGIAAWVYVNSTFLSFEDVYKVKTDFKEMRVDGFTFLDRNDNGKLDDYEDTRKSTDERVEDILTQMTVEEKIHLLKGSGMASATSTIVPPSLASRRVWSCT